MGSLDRIVDLQISVSSRAPSRASFGTPLIAAYHTNYADRVREYSDKDDLLLDGFTVNDPVYRKAQTLMSQNPRPRSFKVGRLTGAVTPTYTLTPINIEEGYQYRITVYLPDGSSEEVTYSVPGAATETTVRDALLPLFTAALGAFGSASSVVGPPVAIEIESASEEPIGFDLSRVDPLNDLKFKEDTADTNLAADLAAIKAADDKFYGLLLAISSEARVKTCASWLESEKKIGWFQSSDSEIVDPSVDTDLFSDLTALSYTRTAVVYEPYRTDSGLDAAFGGQQLPRDPGTYTMAFKPANGVAGLDLRESYRNTIEAKRGNWFGEVGGVNVFYNGITPSGEWIDVTRFIDLLYARIQEAIYAAKLANDKIPYTDIGVAALAGVVRGVLSRNTSTETVVLGLAGDPAPTVEVTPVQDADPADKIARAYRLIRFGGTLSGAIHETEVRGNITP